MTCDHLVVSQSSGASPVSDVQPEKQELKSVTAGQLSNSPAGIAVSDVQPEKQEKKYVTAGQLSNSPAGIAVSDVQPEKQELKDEILFFGMIVSTESRYSGWLL